MNTTPPIANIEIRKDGPYLVSGAVPPSEQHIVTDVQGESSDYREGKKYPPQTQYALCRCGQSGNKPFCDGMHKKVQFDGTESASREPYLTQAETIDGPTVQLTDAESLSAFARFCDRKGRTDDPEVRRIVEYEAAHCQAGRLVVRERKTGKAIEPGFEASLGLVKTPRSGSAGRSGSAAGFRVVSSDRKTYEVRNRMTLCRCRRSNNKPFCDGSHAA